MLLLDKKLLHIEEKKKKLTCWLALVIFPGTVSIAPGFTKSLHPKKQMSILKTASEMHVALQWLKEWSISGLRVVC